MNKLPENTRVYQNQNGWAAETIVYHLEQSYQLSTRKSHSGDIVSTYIKVNIGKGAMTSCLSDLRQLSREKARATENKVRELHFCALEMFDKIKFEIQPEEKQVPVIGTILFLDGYGKYKGARENAHVVYATEETGFGTNFLTVELDTLELNKYDHPRPFSEKFGIGIYFEPDYKFSGSIEELNELVAKAEVKKAEAAERISKERSRLAREREVNIQLGKKIVSVPGSVKAVIVADLYEDESDSMTDYFNTKVKSRFFLAFSATQRNNMRELEKSCHNWGETKNLLKKEDTVKHTDGHSYLPDYFIGSDRWNGLKVHKISFDPENAGSVDELYIAAAEGRCFIQSSPAAASQTLSSREIQKVPYSEKSFALIGDTKSVKEKLKELGGRFNARLNCGPGWIFPLTQEEKVEAFLRAV